MFSPGRYVVTGTEKNLTVLCASEDADEQVGW